MSDAAYHARAAREAMNEGARARALTLARAAAAGPLGLADLVDTGHVLSHCDRPDLALPLFEQAGTLAPLDADILYNLATAQRACGMLESAEQTLQRLLSLRPGDGEAHYLRVSLRRQTPADSGLAEMHEAISGLGEHAGRDNVALHFAMAKTLDDLDEHEAAFAYYARGNRLRRQGLRYDVRDDLAVLDHLARQAVSSGPLARRREDGPIFVVGLPRSGTTLTETILGVHSDVTAVGELEAFPRAVVALAGEATDRMDFAERAARIDPEQLAATYLDLVGDRRGQTRWFTDKLPLNGLYIDLIARAFPASPIVWLERDPVANGFAMYTTLFAQAYPFSYHQAELGAYLRGWHCLHHAARTALGDRLFTLPYETLVDNPRETIERLLAYCRLDWQEACLAPHLARKPVSSASAVQVREPIHRRSMARWRHFERWLQPLMAEIGRAVPASAEQGR